MNDNKLIKDIEKLAVNAVEDAYEKGYNRGYNAAIDVFKKITEKWYGPTESEACIKELEATRDDGDVILGKPIIVDGPKGPITYYPVEETDD